MILISFETFVSNFSISFLTLFQSNFPFPAPIGGRETLFISNCLNNSSNFFNPASIYSIFEFSLQLLLVGTLMVLLLFSSVYIKSFTMSIFKKFLDILF